jgi:hypothetical protein
MPILKLRIRSHEPDGRILGHVSFPFYQSTALGHLDCASGPGGDSGGDRAPRLVARLALAPIPYRPIKHEKSVVNPSITRRRDASVKRREEGRGKMNEERGKRKEERCVPPAGDRSIRSAARRPKPGPRVPYSSSSSPSSSSPSSRKSCRPPAAPDEGGPHSRIPFSPWILGVRLPASPELGPNRGRMA